MLLKGYLHVRVLDCTIVQTPMRPGTTLALRVHIRVYPEDTTACWIMLAAMEPTD
jgi:hypothetical protein